MNQNTFLDVDDSILANSLILPENVRNCEIGEGAKRFDSNPFFLVTPKPGACVKAKTDGGEKVFLNICTSDKIPAPEDITDARLLEILSEEMPSFVVPMSIGNERLEPDKGGTPCLTYDIAINSSYFEKCQKKRHFWLFTVSVVMDGVSNKFEKNLHTEKYTVLKNKKVHGTLQQHRIENREPRKEPQVRKALIEEIESHRVGPTATPDEKQTKAQCVLLRQPPEGVPKRFIGLFQIPKGIAGENVAVHLNSDRVVVTVDKTNLSYDILLPHHVKVETAKSLLDKDLGILRLNIQTENTGGTGHDV